MDCRGGMPSPKNTQGSSKRKVRRQDGLTEYAAFFESLMGGPSVRALCDMSMAEQQVREYLNHCPSSTTESGQQAPLGPAPPPQGSAGVPPPPPGCAGRILSRNANGTIAMTSQPTNESELQLYRVLQRANLLSYYDTFICQGGDDVQQLCEAGEEEFLEIMALVGMASKPLHVRRLQKALQEWVNNPAMFQTPLVPSLGPPGHHPPPPPMQHGVSPVARPMGLAPPLRPPVSASPGLKEPPPRIHHAPPPPPPPPPPVSAPQAPFGQTNLTDWTPRTPSQEPISAPTGMLGSGGDSSETGGRPLTPPTPVLVEAQIRRLAESAELLVRSLPPHAFVDPRPHGRRMCKDLEHVLSMSEDDPRRMDEIRKYAAIYGRFDCKRKPEKPLTLHEVSVNEAAAQICKHIPALLTRRDELFPLARQAVRDSGYPFSKGQSSADDPCRSQCYGPKFEDEPAASKRARLEQPMEKAHMEEEKKKRQERLEGICEQLRLLGRQQEELKARLQASRDLPPNVGAVPQLQSQLEHISTQQMQLINEQSELSKQLRRIDKFCTNAAKMQYGRLSSCSEQEKADTDDTDSQFSAYSNNSSPTLSHEAHDSPSQDSNQSSNLAQQQQAPPSAADVFNMKMASVKKTSAQITKQLVQETLMDEGLRVIKELASQIKSEDSSATDLSSPPPRPRGRPPRLDRGDYVGTSRVVRGAPPPHPSMQNGHERPGSNGGLELHHPNGTVDEAADAENSLNALLALSQKSLMKQEPASPATIKMD
ncbi:NGFI-A-binding protein homolog isoform X4 [Rhipicephalus microplus]|uniref:NGFI-A-binding protein homolog isoform X4 n=1 Tax=Rhipicephalus microplus TaxID=6941 RepID=UPI003F6C9624